MDKRRLLQINPVLRQSTSTGRIMREIGEVVMSAGWESYLAFSRGRDGDMASTSQTVPVGTRLDVAAHGLSTRLLDRHGLGSRRATRRFIADIERIDPDIIHIHNIHGYFLNYPMLFRYLAECGKPVIWTVHDCWLYTGHCYHYSFIGCDRWERGCGHCPQRGSFPRSWVRDRSAKNFRQKRDAFLSVPADKFVIVPVSDWIRGEMSRSFLKGCRYEVIHNGIDLEAFSPREGTGVRAKYGIGADDTLILGLASIWIKEKGFDDLMKMSEMLRGGERLVMVGKMTPEQEKSLPKGITYIRRTDNVAELAELYSAATAFVNPTWQDNYPTVNLEAQACGTPVVTYRTGGSPESLTPATGRIVEQGDVAGMLSAVRELRNLDREELRALCRFHAEANFSKHDRYKDYLRLYESLLGR